MKLVQTSFEELMHDNLYNYDVDFEGRKYTVSDFYEELSKKSKNGYTKIIGCNIVSSHGDIPLFDWDSDNVDFTIMDPDYFESIKNTIIQKATAAVIGDYEYYYLDLEVKDEK